MPGISLRYDSSNTSTNIKYENDKLLKALDSTVYNSNYKREILIRDQHYVLASSRYPEYPIKIFEDSNFWVCVEGKIYGKNDSVIATELENLLNLIFTTNASNANIADAKGDNNKLVNWLLKTDGEFIIYALNKKTKDFAIMNDVLGRLPFYYHYNTNSGLTISRELNLLAFLLDGDSNSKFDKMAIAQYLLFGYPLGKRTILADVFRVQPGSLLRIYNNKNNNNNNIGFKIDILHSFNFDNRKYADRDIKEHAAELVSLFSEASKNRAHLNEDNGKKNIVSLSGGLDSRCVIAAFNNNKIPCSAVTYVAPGWTPVPTLDNDSEVKVAKKLADMFGIEWKNYDLIDPKAIDLLNLLKIKHGAAYLGYGFTLPFLEELKKRYNGLDVTFFTGEGRETVLPDYIHSKKFKDLNDLVAHIIKRKGNFPLGDIAAITQIEESELIYEIKNVISIYPEKNLNQKYVHFAIYETAFKNIFEIEDKDRYYFWSVSPFYSIPFFDYAANCDANSKPYQTLYREFLFQLSRSAAGIDKSDYGASITSYKYRTILFIQTIVYKYPYIGRIIKKITGKRKRHYDNDSKAIRCLRHQIKNCKSISSYLSCTELRRIANNSARYSRRAIDLLFTVTSLIEKTHGNEGSITRFYV